MLPSYFILLKICPCRLLAVLEQLADTYPLAVGTSSEIILRKNFGIVIVPVDPEAFSGQALSALLGSQFDFSGIGSEDIVFETIEGATASIVLPPTLFDGLDVGNDVRIVCNIYVNDRLFLRRQDYLEENKLTNNKLESIIISARIADNITVSSLEDPVQVTFLKNPVSYIHTAYKVIL